MWHHCLPCAAAAACHGSDQETAEPLPADAHGNEFWNFFVFSLGCWQDDNGLEHATSRLGKETWLLLHNRNGTAQAYTLQNSSSLYTVVVVVMMTMMA